MKFGKIARYFTRNNREANFVILDGGPGTGKTNFTCLIIESLIVDFDFDIITNISFIENAYLKHPEKEQELYKKIYSRIYFASTYSEWLRATTKIKGHNVTIIDDAQSSIISAKSIMSKHGQNNSDFARYIRKRKSNLWYVSHDPKYIPYSIYNKEHMYLKKPDKYKIQLGKKTWKGVTKSKLIIDTYDSSTWTYDIDVNFVMQQLNRLSESERDKKILEIINGDNKDNLEAKQVLFWLLKNGYPDKQHYEIFPSFYNWKREFEKS